MEIEVKQRNQRNRRRERAQRMQAQRESKVKDGDSGEDESPAREKPPRPPARRKKSREPLGEEDIIDGFAIMAFRTYEDLEAAVKCVTSPRTNSLSSKPRLPLATLTGDATRNHPPNNVNSHGITLLQDAGTSDDSGRASERLTGSSVAPRDPDSSRDRLSDASSRCSSGKGYICDSEGDDDKASADNSRNASPRYHDASMEDVSEASSLFRVAGGGAGAVAGGKKELVARGGSGGALALSRAPVGGSASPAPAPLPQPAPSPAPAALPPPALPPPPFRADTPHRAHIPALDGHAHAATPVPARPADTPAPERPTNKLQPGARAAADSPTPAPPAPSPLFPSYQAHAALPDYRHTNHETRGAPQPVAGAPPPAAAPAPTAAAPLNLRAPAAPHSHPHPVLPGHDVRPPQAVSLASLVSSAPPPAPTSLPTQTLAGRPLSPTAQTSRSYPVPSIPSSHINSSLSSTVHNHAIPYQSQASLQKHSVPPVYANRPPHLAPFSVANHISSHRPSSTASLPAAPHLSHPINSHSMINHHLPPSNAAPLTTAPNHVPPSVGAPSVTSALPPYIPSVKLPGLSLPPHPSSIAASPMHPPSSAPAVVTAVSASSQAVSSAAELPSRITSSPSVSAANGYPPPAAYAGAAYPPLYAPYATTLQHSPYLPPAAASPRNSADTRTSLSASPLVAPKTPKGVRPHTPGSSGAAGAAPLHQPHSYSPRGHSPNRERESFSNISSLSRASGSTPVSSVSTTGAALVTGPAVPGVSGLLPAAPPALAPALAPPLPVSLAPPMAPPLAAPLAAPLATPLAAPLAAPTPTPAAPAATHLTHSLAPVPTVGSISSGAKPPAHWGVTRNPAPERPGFPPAPLFGAPLGPPNPNPFPAESLFQTSPGADLLRRELDSRFLAAAGGFSVRTEMHHHQHQHTHVHQHPHAAPPAAPPPHHPHQLYPPHAPLFKDVGKIPSLYRTGLGLGYPYSSSLLHPPSPYVPPAPLSTYAPKPVVSAASDPANKPPRPPVAKTGKWNAMHVRIAWEIYNHQQKEKAGGGGPDKDKLRAFPPPPAPAPPATHAPHAPPAPAYRSPYDLPPAYLPPHHPHLGVSPFARYGASSFPGAPPPFGLSPYARELALSSSMHGVHHPPSLVALHDAWRTAAAGPPSRPPPAAAAAAAAAHAAHAANDARREHEERARRERDERERERERREREERERRKQREREMERARQRSPLRNGAPEPAKEERKEAPRPPPALPPYPPPPAAWDPYRFDPLHHMRFTPLVEAAIRAEEDRAKMLSAYAHHQQLKSSGLLHRGLAPLGVGALGPAPLPPLQLPHAPMQPLDLLKKEEPR